MSKKKTRSKELRRLKHEAFKSVRKSSNAFLETYEWRKLRMQAIKKYGARCQCCGATPADGIKINVDHIKPRMFFPNLALELSNLQILCDVCNHGKGNWDMTDWRGIDDASKQHLQAIAQE